MTSKLPGGSGDTSHKVIVKGKYLAAIDNYVSTLAIGQELIVKWNSEIEALQEAIVGLHGRFLSKSNALNIVIDKCFEFEAEHLGRTGHLSDPSNSDLRTSLVGRIKDYLESLPRKYTLRIGLASFPQWDVATYEISKSIRIVTGNPALTGINALTRLTQEHGGMPHFATYIEFSASGYSDWSPDSQAASVGLSFAKQCAFILTTHGICKSNYKQSKAAATLSDDSMGFTKEIVLPDAIARCFGQLIPNEEKLLVYDKDGLTIMSANPGRPAATNEERSMAFDEVLYHVRRFFGAQNHPDFESIAVAIEWYQDSIFADNQTFSYVAACIGLEALFGSDGYLENMSKRLADRYAFLLGKSRTERENMITEYTDVLKLRGRLVHSKAARLSGEDLGLLHTAQKMLLNAVWHELYVMYKAKDDQQQA